MIVIKLEMPAAGMNVRQLAVAGQQQSLVRPVAACSCDSSSSAATLLTFPFGHYEIMMSQSGGVIGSNQRTCGDLTPQCFLTGLNSLSAVLSHNAGSSG